MRVGTAPGAVDADAHLGVGEAQHHLGDIFAGAAVGRQLPRLCHDALRDAAAAGCACAKVELLTQDDWDIVGAESEQGMAEADLALLDRLAALALAGNDAFADLRSVFEDDLRLRMVAALSGKQVE